MPYLATGKIMAFDIGPDGNAYLALAKKTLDYRTSSGASTKTVPDRPQQYRILSVTEMGEIVLDVTMKDVPYNIHNVQPLHDGLLLTCARSYYYGQGNAERNGHIYSLDGQLQESLLLGDGILSVQVTQSGVIWTSYFDEGVFGNYGWREPLGASGLVAWNGVGEKLYNYFPPAGLDSICDCYALNIEFENVTWFYYYTQFPLVRLRDFAVERYWEMPISGSDAFAVESWHALFRGGYGDHDTYSLFSLKKERPMLVREFALRTPEEESLVFSWARGRRDALWLIDETRLYRLSIHETLQ